MSSLKQRVSGAVASVPIAVISIAGVLTGCQSNNVYVAADTSLGVAGSINTAKTSGKLLVGYDRDFVAYVPRDADTGDAMSAYNCTYFKVEGIQLTEFTESLATGEAAQALGTKSKGDGIETNCGTPVAGGGK